MAARAPGEIRDADSASASRGRDALFVVEERLPPDGSTTRFNAAFKRRTGETPSAYQALGQAPAASGRTED
jgi:hypothetical protein